MVTETFWNVVFTISKIFLPFLGKFSQNYQNCLLKIKFGIPTNLNILNSMVILTFSVLGQEYLFWANLVLKIKTVYLRRKFVPRLIGICWIWWWCLLFLVGTENTFFEQMWSKNSKLSFKTDSNVLNLMVIFNFFILDCRFLFWANLVQKPKLCD